MSQPTITTETINDITEALQKSGFPGPEVPFAEWTDEHLRLLHEEILPYLKGFTGLACELGSQAACDQQVPLEQVNRTIESFAKHRPDHPFTSFKDLAERGPSQQPELERDLLKIKLEKLSGQLDDVRKQLVETQKDAAQLRKEALAHTAPPPAHTTADKPAGNSATDSGGKPANDSGGKPANDPAGHHSWQQTGTAALNSVCQAINLLHAIMTAFRRGQTRRFRWEAATFWGRIRIILEDAARIGIPLVCVALTGGGATSMVLAGSATYATVIGAYNPNPMPVITLFEKFLERASPYAIANSFFGPAGVISVAMFQEFKAALRGLIVQDVELYEEVIIMMRENDHAH